MKQLFDGSFAPVTFGCVFFRVPLASLVDEYVSWTRRNFPGATVDPLSGSFAEALERLAPLTAPPSKDLLIGTGTDWTAVFSNGMSNDSFSLAPYWSSRLGIDAIALNCIPDQKDRIAVGAYGKYRSMQVQVFSAGNSPDEPRRTLSSVRDGDRWVFLNQGELFSFEDADRLSARAVRDRVSPADLEAFSKHFGLPTSESEFSGPAALVATHSSSIRRSLSYSEAQAALGVVLKR